MGMSDYPRSADKEHLVYAGTSGVGAHATCSATVTVLLSLQAALPPTAGRTTRCFVTRFVPSLNNSSVRTEAAAGAV